MLCCFKIVFLHVLTLDILALKKWCQDFKTPTSRDAEEWPHHIGLCLTLHQLFSRPGCLKGRKTTVQNTASWCLQVVKTTAMVKDCIATFFVIFFRQKKTRTDGFHLAPGTWSSDFRTAVASACTCNDLKEIADCEEIAADDLNRKTRTLLTLRGTKVLQPSTGQRPACLAKSSFQWIENFWVFRPDPSKPRPKKVEI